MMPNRPSAKIVARTLTRRSRYGADVSAFRAWDRRIVGMTFRPDSAKHPIEHARESDQFVKRHIRPPVLSEGFHHVGEPSSLTITARHVVQL